MSAIRIGVIGDLHTHWDDVDVVQFDRSDYDLLLFTGDLGGGTPASSLRVARTISRLRKQALVMPGNNDTGDIRQLAAELAHRGGMKQLSAIRQGRHQDDNLSAQPVVRLCGYSNHILQRDDLAVTLIAGRPHSMGGAALSFAAHMQSVYGIDSIEASAQRLCDLVDQTTTERLVFLSHNGPVGLGDEPHAMWGCDFKPGGGDWGDPDLAVAIDHALARGRQVLAVVGGHMHLRTKCGNERPWRLDREGVVYVNAARVPRIFSSSENTHRHHVALTITRDGAQVAEVIVPQYDDQQ